MMGGSRSASSAGEPVVPIPKGDQFPGAGSDLDGDEKKITEMQVSTSTRSKEENKERERLPLDPYYSWMNRVLFRKSEEQIELQELPPLPSRDLLLRKRNWKRTGSGELPEQPPGGHEGSSSSTFVNLQPLRSSFVYRIWLDERRSLLTATVVQFTQLGCQVSIPLLIHSFVLSLESCSNPDAEKERLFYPIVDLYGTNDVACGADSSLISGGISGFADVNPKLFAYVFAQWACAMGSAALQNMNLHLMYNIGQRLRARTIQLVWMKILTSHAATLDQGLALNLIANDAQRFVEVAPLFQMVYTAPALVVLCTYCLFLLIGVPTMIVVGGLLLMIVYNVNISRWLQRVRARRVALTDKRMRLCNELLQGIRIVKYFAWEAPYVAKVREMRKKEVRLARNEMIAHGMNMLSYAFWPQCCIGVSMVVYSLAFGNLTPSRAFGTLVFIGVLRFPLIRMGDCVMGIMQARVAIRRLEAYLLGEEGGRRGCLAVGNDCGSDSDNATSGKEGFFSKKEDDILIHFHNADIRWSTAAREAFQKQQESLLNAKSKASVAGGGQSISILPNSSSPKRAFDAARKARRSAGSVLLQLLNFKDENLGASSGIEVEEGAFERRKAEQAEKGTEDEEVQGTKDIIKCEEERDSRSRAIVEVETARDEEDPDLGLLSATLQERDAEVADPSSSSLFLNAMKVLDVSPPLTNAPTLRSLTLTLRRGDFGVLFGRVGAGKSTLLYTLLGETIVQDAREQARVDDDVENVDAEQTSTRFPSPPEAPISSGLLCRDRSGVTNLSSAASTLSPNLSKETSAQAEALPEQVDKEVEAERQHEHGAQEQATTKRMAYCSQSPWIRNCSIKENILFLRPFDKLKYARAVDVACLEADMKQFPHADNTEIGEKGVTLSGGQKARVALARAIYDAENVDIFLLDDIFAALDVHTGQAVRCKLFENLLDAKQHAVLLATSQHMKAWGAAGAGQEVVSSTTSDEAATGTMKIRRFAISRTSGRFKELKPEESPAGIAATGPVTQMDDINLSEQRPLENASYANPQKVVEDASTTSSDKVEDVNISDDQEVDENDNEITTEKMGNIKNENHIKNNKDPDLMQKEERATGSSLKRKTIHLYITSMGKIGFPVLLFWTICVNCERASIVGYDAWVAEWSRCNVELEDVAENRRQTTDCVQTDSDSFYVGIYLGFLVSGFCFMATVRLIGPFMCSRASATLFDRMLCAVVRAPAWWFDTTPIGRLLNRFSFDAEILDSLLFSQMFAALVSLSWTSGALGLLSFVYFPFFFFVLPVFVFIYARLLGVCRGSIRDLQRLNATTRSPIIALVTEACAGLTTIRCFRLRETYEKQMASLVDGNSRALFAFNSANRWLGVRAESLSASMSLIAGCLAVLLRVSAGELGLSLVWCMNLSLSMNYTCMFFSVFEAAFTSVERVGEYGNLPKDGNRHSEFEEDTVSLMEHGDKGRINAGMCKPNKEQSVDVEEQDTSLERPITSLPLGSPSSPK
ncbi:unnamed protein product [Amoebophrya sp. A25]|nr:unnamed protein product [Amoebophrya sp. A25]|eukprot:GSA25T00017041001.1